jgi:hypothetical protein
VGRWRSREWSRGCARHHNSGRRTSRSSEAAEKKKRIPPIIIFKTETFSSSNYESNVWPITGNFNINGIFENKNETADIKEILLEIKSRKMKWAGHAVRILETRIVCKISVRRLEDDRSPERPRTWLNADLTATHSSLLVCAHIGKPYLTWRLLFPEQ